MTLQSHRVHHVALPTYSTPIGACISCTPSAPSTASVKDERTAAAGSQQVGSITLPPHPTLSAGGDLDFHLPQQEQAHTSSASICCLHDDVGSQAAVNQSPPVHACKANSLDALPDTKDVAATHKITGQLHNRSPRKVEASCLMTGSGSDNNVVLPATSSPSQDKHNDVMPAVKNDIGKTQYTSQRPPSISSSRPPNVSGAGYTHLNQYELKHEIGKVIFQSN